MIRRAAAGGEQEETRRAGQQEESGGKPRVEQESRREDGKQGRGQGTSTGKVGGVQEKWGQNE
jgi:hypothetical protein